MLYNRALARRKLLRAQRSSWLRSLSSTQLRAPRRCRQCAAMRFFYEFRVSRHAFHVSCIACENSTRDPISTKSFSMARRTGANPSRMLALFRATIAAQHGLDYYTFIPLTAVPGDPFCASPERLDRATKYVPGNIVATGQALNVGYGMNWSRRFSLQLARAAEFPDAVLSAATVRSFLTRCLGVMRKSARQRALCESRQDFSGEFALTRQDCDAQLRSQGYRCALSGLPLSFSAGHAFCASPDRLDPARGYVPGNVRFVVLRLNGPHTWTDASFARLLLGIRGNYDRIAETLGRPTLADLLEHDPELAAREASLPVNEESGHTKLAQHHVKEVLAKRPVVPVVLAATVRHAR